MGNYRDYSNEERAAAGARSRRQAAARAGEKQRRTELARIGGNYQARRGEKYSGPRGSLVVNGVPDRQEANPTPQPQKPVSSKPSQAQTKYVYQFVDGKMVKVARR